MPGVHERTAGEGIARLEQIVAELRGENGCPWDRKQTLESLKPYLVEEAYELIDAIDGGDPVEHEEELGDVLLQVVLQTQLQRERNAFTLDDVAHRIAEKLVRRHPHVFSDTEVENTEEVLRNWEAIKAREKGGETLRSALDGVPRHLPALLKAQRMQAKASRVGFDWDSVGGALDKITEELAELRCEVEGGERDAVAAEMGDLLFSIVNLCRFLEVDAEQSLDLTNKKFLRRFKSVESRVRESGREMVECTLAELDGIWDQVKAVERGEQTDPA